MRKYAIAALIAVFALFGCTGTAWADGSAPSLRTGASSELSLPLPSAHRCAQEGGGDVPSLAGQARHTASKASHKSARSKKTQRPKAKRTLADGVYYLGAFGRMSNVLDVPGASIDTGANVALGRGSGTLSQRWQVAYDGAGAYTITNVASGLMLAVDCSDTSSHANVVQSARCPKRAAQWEIRRAKAGTFTLVNKLNGQAAYVVGGRNAAGSNVRCCPVRGAAYQCFAFKKTHMLYSGLYSLYTKLSPTRGVVSIGGNAVANGARAELSVAGGTLGQRFKVTYLRCDTYSIQAASGRYLADIGNAVVQAARPRSGNLSPRQQWTANVQGGGVTFTNRLTGRCITVAGGRAVNGAKLSTTRFVSARSQCFRPVREARLLEAGMFTFRTRASAMQLDVTNASWDDGANVTVWTAHDGLAQKFVVVPTGGYCRISMALSGTVLEARDASGANANACMGARWSRTASQLWYPRIGDNGIEFVNKATGGVLSVAAGGKRAGANVGTARSRGLANQAWMLLPTGVTHVRSLVDLTNVIRHAPSTGDGEIGVGGWARGYQMSDRRRDELASALDEARSRGEQASAVMVDLSTGISVCVGADRVNYGASTFKAAYVTYLFSDLLEHGVDLGGGTWDLMRQTIGQSSNDAYHTLRSRFGSGGFSSWLDEIGLEHLAGDYYPFLTARQFALIWAKIYAYTQSGGDYVDDWHALFDHSYRSFIREGLDGSNAVFSKPGWYPQDADYGALDDGAIVRDSRGRAYLLVALSNANCNSEQWMMEDLARAMDAIHHEIVGG